MHNETNNKTLPAEVINAISSGRKIEAIKLIREEWNIGLKEAKEIVDKHIDSDPLLKDQIQRQSNIGCLPIIVSFIIIAAGAYALFLR